MDNTDKHSMNVQIWAPSDRNPHNFHHIYFIYLFQKLMVMAKSLHLLFFSVNENVYSVLVFVILSVFIKKRPRTISKDITNSEDMLGFLVSDRSFKNIRFLPDSDNVFHFLASWLKAYSRYNAELVLSWQKYTDVDSHHHRHGGWSDHQTGLQPGSRRRQPAVRRGALLPERLPRLPQR